MTDTTGNTIAWANADGYTVRKIRTHAGWHNVIVGANGEPVWSTEVYTSEAAADESAARTGLPVTTHDLR